MTADLAAPRPWVRIHADVLAEHVADEMVLLHQTNERYFSLDPVGTRMLDLACRLADAGAVVAQLELEFEAAPAVLRHDLETLLGELVEAGLIEREATETV